MATRQDSVLRIPVSPPAVGIVSMLLATLLAVAPLFVSLLLRDDVVREFRNLHASFGAAVPAVSKLLLLYAPIARWIAIALAGAQLAVLVILTFQRTAAARRRYFWFAIPCALVALSVVMVFYAPIVSLGAVV